MNIDLFVRCPAEPAAGLFECSWTIEGVNPVDREQREAIRKAFSDAFELVTGGKNQVTFSDEFPPDPWPELQELVEREIESTWSDRAKDPSYGSKLP